MQHTRILALDIGTSALKAALVDGDGHAQWLGHQTLPAGTGLHRNWNPAWWLAAFTKLLHDFMRSDQSRPPPQGIVISGHGPSMVALDKAGKVINPAMLWLDGQQSKKPDTRSYYLPKLAWWREHRPELWAQARRFISVPEYLSFVLGGEAVTVCPSDDFAPYLWTSQEIGTYGLEPALLPPMVQPGSPIGKVGVQAAQDFGLPAGIPLFAGGSDFMMSLAGTGAIQPGRTCDRAGSSEGINYCSDKQLDDADLRVLPHLVAGYWNIAGILPATGLLFEWFRSLTGMKRLGYHETLEAIGHLPIQGDLPFFRSVPGSSATEFATASFCGLKLDHEAIHLARAVVESIGFAVRTRLESMQAAGCDLGAITLCGGQAKNRPWVQMKADITGHELLVPHIKDAELLGDAMMGMIGLGRYSGLSEAATMVKIEERVLPNQTSHLAWSARYAEFQEIMRNGQSHI